MLLTDIAQFHCLTVENVVVGLVTTSAAASRRASTEVLDPRLAAVCLGSQVFFSKGNFLFRKMVPIFSNAVDL